MLIEGTLETLQSVPKSIVAFPSALYLRAPFTCPLVTTPCGFARCNVAKTDRTKAFPQTKTTGKVFATLSATATFRGEQRVNAPRRRHSGRRTATHESARPFLPAVTGDLRVPVATRHCGRKTASYQKPAISPLSIPQCRSHGCKQSEPKWRGRGRICLLLWNITNRFKCESALGAGRFGRMLLSVTMNKMKSMNIYA